MLGTVDTMLQFETSQADFLDLLVVAGWTTPAQCRRSNPLRTMHTALLSPTTTPTQLDSSSGSPLPTPTTVLRLTRLTPILHQEDKVVLSNQVPLFPSTIISDFFQANPSPFFRVCRPRRQ